MSFVLYSGRLALSPSANKLVRPAVFGTKANGKPRIRFVKTNVADAWVRYAALQLQATGVREPFPGPMQLECDFVVPTISSDMSNRLKQLEDVLSGRAWFDDLQLVRGYQTKRVRRDGEEPHVVFRVRVVEAKDVDPETLKRILSSTKGKPREQARSQGQGVSLGGAAPRVATPSVGRPRR